MSSIRHLVPRASLSLHSKQLQHRLLLPTLRPASAKTPPPKPRVLEKPERFNPPSHPSRLRSKPRQYPGPPLSENERQAQKTRRYPHMMPAEGTFMHWFLTHRWIHFALSMTILISLVLAIWFRDFTTTTPYTRLLPPNSMFWAHPIAFIRQYLEVYYMHVLHTSQTTAERRRENVEDARKRSLYRKAHGIAWEEGKVEWKSQAELEAHERAAEARVVEDKERREKVKRSVRSEEAFVDFEGREQRGGSKWFGIW